MYFILNNRIQCLTYLSCSAITSCLISSGKAAKNEGSTPSGTSADTGGADAVDGMSVVVSDTVALSTASLVELTNIGTLYKYTVYARNLQV